jgi:tetratricopeptide (TPR) repeat protein
VPEGLDPADLDHDLRREVESLSATVSERVAGHLLAAIEAVDSDPDLALRHARAARAQGGRLGTVREAVGVIAYEAGDWALALADLRAGRRITGHHDLIALEADCERALGRPEKALALATGPLAASLDPAGAIELAIVASGARRDLGQARAAVLALEAVGATDRQARPWSARLRYAYAAALLDAGRRQDARHWFEQAAAVDADQLTDAEERAAALRD